MALGMVAGDHHLNLECGVSPTVIPPINEEVFFFLCNLDKMSLMLLGDEAASSSEPGREQRSRSRGREETRGYLSKNEELLTIRQSHLLVGHGP